MEYQYKTTPYPHQAREFPVTRDPKTFAIFWEQRTGKTKHITDTVAYNYEQGKIDALFIVAPPGVHAQWILDEIPTHLPDRIRYIALIYRTGREPKTFAKKLDTVIAQTDVLAVFAMNTQALITKAGTAAAKKFLTGRKALFAFDESADIRTPSAKITRSAIKLGKLATMRRILAGVPAPEGPMDYYSQFRFLHQEIIGCRNFMEYKLKYGEWEFVNRSSMERVPIEKAMGRVQLRPGFFMIPKKRNGVKVYKNIDDLMTKVAWRMSRVTQREAFPDMPEKQYQRFYVDMTENQTTVYNQLAEEYEATLSNRTIEVPLLITRLIRLQQIVCGYLPMPIDTEDLDDNFDWFDTPENQPIQKQKYEIVRIPGATNPRLEVMDEILRLRSGDPAIVWARFKPDIDHLLAHYPDAVRYDGSVTAEERQETKQLFQLGQIPLLIGNQKAGGTGLTLKPAQTVIYYSNYFGLLPRAQSEDRPIHGELTRPILYADLVARGTMEERLVDLLRHKRDLFQELMGDRAKDWFTQAA